MDAISARVVPHIIRDRVSPVRGLTVTLLPSTVVSTRSVSGSFSSPNLPFAVRMPPAMATCTPAGISTGYLPTRDIPASPSEHAAEHFAANVGGASLCIAHDATRRRQDRNTKAGIHAREFLDLRVDAPPRLGDAGDLLDDRLAFVVLQLDAQLRHARTQFLRGVATNEALTLQHTENIRPQLGCRRGADRMPRALGVADAGQHIPQRVG